MDHQMVVVAGRVIKIMSFRSHQEGRRPAMPSEKVFAAFLQGEQAVNRCPELPAHVPVIQRGGQHDNIARFYRGIDLVHAVPLDAGGLVSTVSAETASAAMNGQVA
jgi:hypothetical protein